MSTNKTLFLLYVCTALLFMQFSGIHIHVDLESSDETVTHNLNLYDIEDHVSAHDHQSSIDIDIFELSTSWSKIFQYFIVTVFLLLCFFLTGKHFFPPPLAQFKFTKRHYWRPILRAPPPLL